MSGDSLDSIFATAIADSESAMATFQREGLASRQLRAESASVITALRLAGRQAADVSEREELRRHADYWRSVRRVLTGRWEEVSLSAYSSEKEEASTLPDEELLLRAAGEIGLNSLVVRDREIAGDVEKFAIKNCRLINVRLSLDVDELLLPETKLVGCGVTAAARASTLDRILLDDSTVAIDGGHDGHLAMYDAELASGIVSFRGDRLELREVLAASGEVAVSFEVDVAVFSECNLSGLTLRGCRARELRLTGGHLENLAFADCIFEQVTVSGQPDAVRARILEAVA